MTIRALSFDFDGCLFHDDYIQNYIREGKNDVIGSNKVLLDGIKEENKEFAKVYTFFGSLRQSKARDEKKSFQQKRTGSCFPALTQINKYLESILDPFLLADIYGDLADELSYYRTMDESYQEKHSDWLSDESKATILYAQMHRMANAHPGEEIIFDFYDGRSLGGYHDLQPLSKFYNQYQWVIPHNVILRLNHYTGGVVTCIAKIKGSGFIDTAYKETVKELVEQAKTDYCDGIINSIDVIKYAKPEHLKSRTALTKGDHKSDLQKKFTGALQKIKEKAQELENAGVKLDKKRKFMEAPSATQCSYTEAAKAARILREVLAGALARYERDGSKDGFQRRVNTAIETAKNSELKNHRGYLKQILGYTGLVVLAVLSVATAGLAYAVAGGVNYAVNGQFFFSTKINTNSINQVLALEKAAYEFSA